MNENKIYAKIVLFYNVNDGSNQENTFSVDLCRRWYHYRQAPD